LLVGSIAQTNSQAPAPPLYFSVRRAISSTSEGRAPNTSARISLAVSSARSLGFTTGLGALGLRRYGPSHENPGWSGLQSPPRCFSPCSAQLPACHRSRRPLLASLAMASRCRSNTGAYMRMHPERPASGPGQRGPSYPWPFRNADAPLSGTNGGSPPGWSTARTEVKVLLTSSSTMSSRSSVLEDAGADAGDKEDPELLQVGVAVSERAASPPGR